MNFCLPDGEQSQGYGSELDEMAHDYIKLVGGV